MKNLSAIVLIVSVILVELFAKSFTKNVTRRDIYDSFSGYLDSDSDFESMSMSRLLKADDSLSLGSDSSYWDNSDVTLESHKHKKKKKKKEKEYNENGKNLNFRGDIREKFAMAAIASRSVENAVCSPLAALFPIGMLTFGAEGKSLKELLRAVGIQKQSSAHSDLKKLRRLVEDVSGVDVLVSSRLYLSRDMKLRSGFKEEAESVFHACTEVVNMRHPSSVAQKINQWVADTTSRQIHNFIEDSDIPADCALILVNAIFFKGVWKHPFTTLGTRPFYGTLGSQSAHTMYVKEYFNYGTSSSLDAEVLEIPFKGSRVSLVVVVPRARNGLGLLISQMKLAPKLLNSVHLAKTKVRVYMPSFRLSSGFDLKSLYKQIGLNRIFRAHSSSGLSRIMKDEIIYVDSAKQRATIDIMPKGAVASSKVFNGGVNPPELDKDIGDGTVTVYCNHPFLFYVVLDKEQLFVGTYKG